MAKKIGQIMRCVCMSNIVPFKRSDYSHIGELIRKMITPDSLSAEPYSFEGVPVYWEPSQSAFDEIIDEDWNVFITTLSYYKHYGVLDPIEALAFFSVVLDPECEGIRISYYLDDFWVDADGLGTIYSWIDRDYLDYGSEFTDLGMYVGRDNQFWHVCPIMIRDFASGILSFLTGELFGGDIYDIDEDDVANMLWALGKLSEIDPNYCVNEIAKLHWYWTDWVDLRFDEMISDFFAEPHITWPHWI